MDEDHTFFLSQLILKEIFGFISNLSLLVIIYCYYYLSEFRSFEFRLIVFLAISNFIDNISINMYFGTTENAYCTFQGFLILTSDFSLVSCGTIISLNIFISTYSLMSEKKKERFINILSLIFSLILPLICSSIYLFLGELGLSNGYCWIKYDENISDFYIHTNICIAYVYIITQCFLNLIFSFVTYVKTNKSTQDRYYVNSTILFSIISILCWLPITITRFIETFRDNSKGHSIFFKVLSYIGIILFVMQGLFITIVSILNKEIQSALKNHLEYDGLFYNKRNGCFSSCNFSCFCCCRKKERLYSEENSAITSSMLRADTKESSRNNSKVLE